MKTLIFTLGGKGGVGKTLALLTLADWLVSKDIPFAALDCDTENAGKASALSSSLPEAARPNLRSIDDCDKLLTVAAENTLTLADLPANASGDFMTWFDSVALPETLEALDLRIIGLGAITPEPGSFASVAEWAQKLQKRVSYVVVLNHRSLARVARDREAAFPEYFQSQTGERFQKTFRPVEVEMHGLFDKSMSFLLRAGKLPSEIEAVPEVPILDRSRIKSWSSQLHAGWEAAAAKLSLV